MDGVAAMERCAGAGARGGVVGRRQTLAVSAARLLVVLGDVVEGLARVGVASEGALAEASRLRREGGGGGHAAEVRGGARAQNRRRRADVRVTPHRAGRARRRFQ